MRVENRLDEIRGRIALAAGKSDRRPENITLVAVTKTLPVEVVLSGYQAGIRHFGENRAEELARKSAEVDKLEAANRIIWHQIGSLQSRKSNLVADHADVFHALDRSKIARRLSNRLTENGRAINRPLPVFLEVNVSGEKSKAGIDCTDWQNDSSKREQLLSLAQEIENLSGLTPRGLMTMAPWKVEEKIVRDVFQQTRQLSEWLQSAAPESDWSKLSMGMTDDFEIAIEEGATHVRIGRAIFGERR
ncbi:MAG: YggS family pyridoxal phosphate-dependent enzyme [Anaerolineae bacterium]|nr:MAG: YggS family pyridoxal phosphate-dependent enzyme [Anaerolineae bacterium]